MPRRPDLVNGIHDLKKLEDLVVSNLPARPPKKMQAEGLAAAVQRHFNFAAGPRVMAHRQEWIDALNATQREDGTWAPAPHSCAWCPLMRATGRVTAALWHLGGRPGRPLKAVERLANPRALVRWLEALHWEHPWGGAGHEVIGLAQAMANTGTCTRGTVQTILDFVNGRMRERDTGLIARGHFDEPGDQQFGSTFAFGIVFEFFKVDFPWAPRLVEFILSRQRRSGSWSKDFPGGSFNMDAAWILSRWTRHGSALRPKAEDALRRLARWLKREVAKRRGEEKKRGLLKIATTLLLLQEVFPSPSHRNRVWRYSCDMTIHP